MNNDKWDGCFANGGELTRRGAFLSARQAKRTWTLIRVVGAMLVVGVATTGCMLFDVHEQQEKIDAACQIGGTVTVAARSEPRPTVVVLVRRTDSDAPGRRWQIADHFVLDRPGKWVFVAGNGQYGLAAFEDTNRDLIYQPGEPLVLFGDKNPMACTPGARFRDVALAVPAVATVRLDSSFDITKLQARSAGAQVITTLGQMTAVGELASLSDDRFKEENAKDSMWRPLDFIVNVHPGIYFLEPYNPQKVPVLFVHGINGTPINFKYLIEHLDRKRFQPWVYYYPSGAHLGAIADHLNQTMAKLKLRYGFKRFGVIAHSMGGLVSRGFILRYAKTAGTDDIPLFVSISTPWGGHKSAQSGIDYSPAVVRVWIDMVPGSEYLRSLFADPLPAATQHYLWFTFLRNTRSLGESDDHTVTVASELVMPAQLGAVQLRGFDYTHDGVLDQPDVSSMLNDLLAQSYYGKK